MIANYGYSDGSGEYYITIDTERCDGCGECVEACPKGIFEVELDDYDEPKARVKDTFATTLGYECPGAAGNCSSEGVVCSIVCAPKAISHSW